MREAITICSAHYLMERRAAGTGKMGAVFPGNRFTQPSQTHTITQKPSNCFTPRSFVHHYLGVFYL